MFAATASQRDSLSPFSAPFQRGQERRAGNNGRGRLVSLGTEFLRRIRMTLTGKTMLIAGLTALSAAGRDFGAACRRPAGS